MSNRPRSVWIGTDTPFVLEGFKNERTQQLFTGITTGTMGVYDGTNDTLIVSLPLVELGDEPGAYEAIVPDDQSGLTEGQPLRLQFEISGGAGFGFRLDAKAVASVKKDSGL